ncbi:MAG: pyridoxal 5'-phosphate synthase glutaminase subunit PdxT [Chloroflexi bacterium]|nr:pyridoxal 5'-phosphate synthase glutaminase subunit PdxT [Chloroflexota bacterium]
MKIGVLALQGDFAEHLAVLGRLEAEAVAVRLPQHLQDLQGLIIPGGESTTIVRLLDTFGLRQPILELARHAPIFGTCAGMILLARRATDLDRPTLGLIDITVQRNAFGRQVDSFEADLAFKGLPGKVHAVFIRAPIILQAEPAVDVLASLPDGTPVAARQGNILVSAFHPELTTDARVHAYFVEIAREHARAS